MSDRMNDKMAIVTGATSGIGAVALLVNLDKTIGLERETFTAQAARVNRC